MIMLASMWGCGMQGLSDLLRSSYCNCGSKVQPKTATRARKQTVASGEVSEDARKEHLFKYIDNILPAVFRSTAEHDSTLQAMWKTIVTYHSYAVVFTAKGPGAKQIRTNKGIYLLTIQSMLMFIMAVFCDLQVCMNNVVM